MRMLLVLLLLVMIPPGVVTAEETGHSMAGEHGHQEPVPRLLMEKHHHDPADPARTAAMADGVGVDERLGQKIPTDAEFVDEHNRTVRLEAFVTMPTLLLPVFYYCPQSCSLMLASLASGIGKVPLNPGSQYRVLALSFDETETPALALRAKKNYLKLLDPAFPEAEWKFVTGSKDQIMRVTRALGYRFHKIGDHDFVHPNAMVVLAGDGTIIRYLYGVHYLPFDMGMALTEAQQGIPGISVRKLLTYCFAYDSNSKTYVFKAFRITAVVTVALLLLMVFLLLRKKKSQEDRT